MPRTLAEEYKDLHPHLDFKQLIQAYREAMALKRTRSFWELGDLAQSVSARAVSARYLDESLIDVFLRETQENETSFSNNRWISVRYPSADERAWPLSWTHYRVAAVAPGLEAQRVLQEAYEKGWSTRDLERAVRQRYGSPGRVKLCDCGCGRPLPETPLELGGKMVGETRYFATLACVKRFLEAMETFA